MTSVLPNLRTLDQTRERVPLPDSTSPAWRDARTVWAIATYAERTVDPAAHDLAHPQPQLGCPWCPQVGLCPTCAQVAPECPDPSGHRRVAAGSESTWRGAAA